MSNRHHPICIKENLFHQLAGNFVTGLPSLIIGVSKLLT